MDPALMAGLPPTPSVPAARTPGRRGWVAGALGSFLCGLGQLYAGHWRRALAFLLGDAVGFVACLLAFVHIHTEPLNLWLPVVVYLGYRLWALVDGVLLARRVAAGFRRRWFTRWYVYVCLAKTIAVSMDPQTGETRWDRGGKVIR